MSETGVNRTLFELFEIIVPILILVIIGGSIIYVSSPNFARSYIFEKEISYVSSVVGKDMRVEIDLSNTKFSDVNVKSENNKVLVNVKGSNLKGTGIDYFGKNVKIEQKSSNVLVITS